jgi:hypothetical protein
MFITAAYIRQALSQLEKVDPFFGITFLVCKKACLPIGSMIELSLNEENKNFLDQFYKPYKDIPSEKPFHPYYRVSRLSDKNKNWLRFDYASSGLQSTNTQKFKDALVHPHNSRSWGWSHDYINQLAKNLYKKKNKMQKISALCIAIWLYRDRNWPEDSNARTLVDTFLDDFFITEEEKQEIFDISVPNLDAQEIFQNSSLITSDIVNLFGRHPEAPPDESGTLAYLEMIKVGPAQSITFNPAERLNLITGDNGLGKTFLLECAWWALTGEWASLPAYPSQNAQPGEAKISFRIAGKESTERIDQVTVPYEWEKQAWLKLDNRPTIPGLIVYARVDGSFAVWDPISQALGDYDSTDAFIFTKDDVWDGADRDFRGRKSSYINGLIRDWVLWQSSPDKHPFGVFQDVLKRLSPPDQSDLGSLCPGDPVRLPRNSKEFPTIKHAYGTIPLPYVSAGVRRIITLAYLIVWAWEEHRIRANQAQREPESRMVILVDEIEAHLHPQWQRAILPALMSVGKDLSDELQIQFLVATHSPLVLTSAEPIFDGGVDGLFQLDLVSQGLTGNEVSLNKHPFIPQGTASAWLQSDVIGLAEERSIPAENLIERAKALQRQDNPIIDDIREISKELSKTLQAEHDEFWPRWIFFAEQHGVIL